MYSYVPSFSPFGVKNKSRPALVYGFLIQFFFCCTGATFPFSPSAAALNGKTVDVREIKTKETDLDDYRTAGTYHFDSAYTPVNIPSGVNGWLVVFPTAGTTTKQLWFRHGSGANSHETFTRTYVGGEWSAWMRYVTESIA